MKPILIVSLFLSLTVPLVADVVSWRQGASNDFVVNYQGVQDTLLASTSSVNNENYGNLDFVLVGRNEQRYSIVSFDLSDMAGTYSSVESASLTLFVSGSPTALNFEILVYSLFASNGGWDQMQATWINQDKAGEIAWKNAGGTDVSNVLGARDSLLQTIDYTTTSTSITIDVPVSMVLGWITSPEDSASLLLMPQGSQGSNTYVATFGSSNQGTMDLRPLLTVHYTAIPEVPTVMLLMGLAGLVAYRRFRTGESEKLSD